VVVQVVAGIVVAVVEAVGLAMAVDLEVASKSYVM
jgi:hypothetical protein